MPCACTIAWFRLPSGLRNAANCGSSRKTRRRRSSPTVSCCLKAAVNSSRSLTSASSVSRRVFGVVEQLDVDVGHLPAQALHLALMRLIPLGARDRLAGDLGHRGSAPFREARIALDAEEDERRKDQQHQHRAAGAWCACGRIRTWWSRLRERRRCGAGARGEPRFASDSGVRCRCAGTPRTRRAADSRASRVRPMAGATGRCRAARLPSALRTEPRCGCARSGPAINAGS